MGKYGNCKTCGAELNPVFFIEDEIAYEGYGGARHPVRTGRKRRAVDYLVCDICGKKECVDNTFDGPWR